MKITGCKAAISLTVLVALLLVRSGSLFAQSEETFMQKMMRRFRREEASAPKKEERITPKKRLRTKEIIEEEKREAKLVEEMTEQELAKRITDKLNNWEEAMDFVSGLSREYDQEGNIYYTYLTKSGITKRLEELDKITLRNLHNRVRSVIVRFQTERVLRQLDMTRRAMSPAPKVPAQAPTTITMPKIPTPPRIYAPPNTPTALGTAPSAPVTLGAPPTTPSALPVPPSPPPQAVSKPPAPAHRRY